LVKTFGDRIRLTGLAPKAVVGAYVHKLAMLICGVLRSGQPFDVDFEKKKLAFQDGIWPHLPSASTIGSPAGWIVNAGRTL
jgi:transposase